MSIVEISKTDVIMNFIVNLMCSTGFFIIFSNISVAIFLIAISRNRYIIKLVEFVLNVNSLLVDIVIYPIFIYTPSFMIWMLFLNSNLSLVKSTEIISKFDLVSVVDSFIAVSLAFIFISLAFKILIDFDRSVK